MNGFLNVYKPPGMTSYDVIRRLKPLLPRVKIGHLGTLDPEAEGVLPLALGQATRLIEYIPDQTKAYHAEMMLGGVSDTQDQTGTITEIPHQPVNREDVLQVLARYCGAIEQVPPMYSAVHYQGRRLYELARQGVTVEVEPRQVTIHRLTLEEMSWINGQEQVTFSVECSSGTYVRTLCHDIGQELGCGGYMSHLTRTAWGVFTEENACALAEITDRAAIECHLLPLGFPLQGMPRIELSEAEARAVAHGMAIGNDGASPGQPILMYYKNELLAIGRGLQVERGLQLRPEKVLAGSN